MMEFVYPHTHLVAGVDEVGRGPLVGAVVTAAVILDPARPIVGLEPLPTEPIYLRRGPSAFSHPAFARRAQGLGGPLALIGFSMTDAVLATAFAAADLQLPVEVLSDAVATGERDDPDLRRALSAPLTSLFPLCRLIQADDLLQEEAAAFVAANAP